MLFIFRKIRKSSFLPGKVRTYLAYAIGEIALIVIGILLALQISEWNQTRMDRVEEKLILSRLSSELSSNSDKLSRLLKGFEKKEKAFEQVLLAFKGMPIEDDSIFLSNVIKSS